MTKPASFTRDHGLISGGGVAVAAAGAASSAVAAHVDDTSDAHDASAISLADPSATALGVDNVQDAIDTIVAAGPGIAGITIDDEGTPLATLATTLDFVGAGVTASGTGAAKTITIPGGASGDTIGQIVIGWDAGIFVLTENTVSVPVEAPFTGTITSWDLFGNPGVAGSCSVDVWKKATYPPTVAESIVNVGSGGAKPGLTASDHTIGGSITHYTTAITAGDIFIARLDSVSLFGMVELVIRYSRP